MRTQALAITVAANETLTAGSQQTETVKLDVNQKRCVAIGIPASINQSQAINLADFQLSVRKGDTIVQDRVCVQDLVYTPSVPAGHRLKPCNFPVEDGTQVTVTITAVTEVTTPTPFELLFELE